MHSHDILERMQQLLASSEDNLEKQRVIKEMLENATREQNHLAITQIHLGLGYHLFDQSRYRSAENHFKLALHHARAFSDEGLAGKALLALAAARGEQGHLEEAIHLTEKARFSLQRSQQWDKIPVTFYNLGECFLKLGRLDEAIDNFEQAIQTGRMVKRIDMIIRSMSMMSRTRFLKGEHELALEDIRQAIMFADKYEKLQEQVNTRVQYLDIIVRMNANLNLATVVAEELATLLTQQKVMNLDALMIMCVFYIQQSDLTHARHWFHILETTISTRMNELSEVTKLKAERIRAKLILADFETIPSLEKRRMRALEVYHGIIQKINENIVNDEDIPVFFLEHAELLLELNKLEECIEYLQQVELIASQRTQPRTFLHAILLQYLVSTLLGKKDQANYLRKRATEIMAHYCLNYLKSMMDQIFVQAEAIEESARINVKSANEGMYSKEQVEFIHSYLQDVINEYSSL